MPEFCSCKDWEDIKNNNPDIFKWHTTYGWVISWIELTDENSHTQIHRYGINIYYCPMCGKKLYPKTENQKA